MQPKASPDRLHGTKLEHPAYGTIVITRGSGKVELFDSDVGHQHFINLTINRATRYDDGAHQFIHSKEQLIEVRMSETQFARAITSMNMGSGAPCTLCYVGTERMPDVELEELLVGARKAFRDKMEVEEERLGKFADELEELRAQKKRPTLAHMDKLVDQIRWLRDRIAANAEYNLTCFEEHMEKVVDEAKAEIEVAALHTQQKLGLPNAPTPKLTNALETD